MDTDYKYNQKRGRKATLLLISATMLINAAFVYSFVNNAPASYAVASVNDNKTELCVKFEGNAIGKNNTELTLGSYNIKLTNWVKKSDDNKDYVGFSYTITGPAGATFTMIVKEGNEGQEPQGTTISSYTGAYINPIATGGSTAKGISYIKFCIKTEPTPTVTATPTQETTPTPSPTASPTVEQTPTTTMTPVATATPTQEVTPTTTPTLEQTPTPTQQVTPTVEQTPTTTVTPVATSTPTMSPTQTIVTTPTTTTTPIASVTPSQTIIPTVTGQVMGIESLPKTESDKSFLTITAMVAVIVTIMTGASVYFRSFKK